MHRPDRVPAMIDIDQPSAARVYDYLLGGSHNFAADRDLARRLLAIGPNAAIIAQLNRAFLRRAVRYLVDAGIRQFVDVGSGIPTAGNVHELARRAAPDTRVCYVDIDPVAVAHSTEILAGEPGVVAIHEDVRRPDAILDHPDLLRIIDPDRPIALLMVSMLHFVGGADDPAGPIAGFRDRMAPGGYLVISHITGDTRPDRAEAVSRLYEDTPTPLYPRDRAGVTRLFDGFTLVDPGLVWLPEWRPDTPDEVDDAAEASSWAGVGYRS